MGRPKKIVVNEGQCVSQLEQRINDLEAKNRNLCEMIERLEAMYHQAQSNYGIEIYENLDLRETLTWITVEYIKYKRMYEGVKRDD